MNVISKTIYNFGNADGKVRKYQKKSYQFCDELWDIIKGYAINGKYHTAIEEIDYTDYTKTMVKRRYLVLQLDWKEKLRYKKRTNEIEYRFYNYVKNTLNWGDDVKNYYNWKEGMEFDLYVFGDFNFQIFAYLLEEADRDKETNCKIAKNGEITINIAEAGHFFSMIYNNIPLEVVWD